ncbi:heat shock 70 kDa protein 12A-like [Mercenaria mercenaria]|uniref:heat shock 70 kDa protein 12A-like n=1 Tax=Mercenaria mercenaria TaxID=6596 RepID=UPI00234F4ED5|nr:heat shock 70 kDa protein 12A-like [Mercenaria mercenaria]
MSKCKEAISRNKLLVAAIDFGTTYSGYAFSFRHDFERDPLKISTNTAWSSSQGKGMQSWKTPTTVLLRPDQSFDSFGYDAEDKYCDLADNEEHQDWYFFKRFKMLLHNKLGLKRDIHIPDAMGKEMPAKTIFAIAIRFIKNHLLQMIEARGIEFYEDDIFWVLTIPAIWNEPAKQFMREAAVEAGMKSDQLKLALEPEAASVYCKTVPTQRMQGEDGQSDTLGPFGPCTRYLVLDIGGGTVDVTVHEVMANGKLKELHKASGGAWGGTRVDASYFELFSNLFGHELMENFKKENKYEHLDMERDFELKKRTVKEEGARVNIHVSAAFVEYVKENMGLAPQDIVNGTNMKDKLTFRRDRIMFQGSVIKEMFDPSIQSIVDHVKEVIKSPKVQRLDKILMVGGFSECALVKKAVKAAFPDIQVVAPDEPGLAVLKGAVIFGHSPEEISSRVVRYTYGVAALGPFYEGRHPEEKRVKIGDEYFCKDSFSKFIGIDADAGDKEVIKRKYDITERDKSLAIEVYVSTEAYPLLCTEDHGCTKLGEIVINVPMGGWRAKAEVEVEFGFGGTEFTVKATEVNTQIDQEAKFDFLS